MVLVLEINKELRRSYALVERNFNLIKRYLGWEVVFMVYTVVNTLTIAFIGLTVQDRIKSFTLWSGLCFGDSCPFCSTKSLSPSSGSGGKGQLSTLSWRL
jgi:hypothetical protein